jgi:hypothetical protein
MNAGGRNMNSSFQRYSVLAVLIVLAAGAFYFGAGDRRRVESRIDVRDPAQGRSREGAGRDAGSNAGKAMTRGAPALAALVIPAAAFRLGKIVRSHEISNRGHES